MMSWALPIGMAGFAGVVIAGMAGKQWMIRNFGQNSADLVTYYYWIFPFGFGLTLYSLLEAYSLHLNKTILTTFLRESDVPHLYDYTYRLVHHRFTD